MNLSRWSRIAEWAVAAAVAGLHVLLMLLPERDDFPGFLAVAGRQTLALCQPAVLLAWIIFGPGRWWWRLPTAGVLAVASAMWWANTDEMFAAFCLAMVAILVVPRLCGLTVRQFDQAQQPRAQFSILMLLAATTVVAGVIGTLEYLRPALATFEVQEVLTFSFPGGKILLPNETFTATTLRAVVLGSASAAIAAGALFAVLRPGAVWLRAIILTVVILALAGYLVHLIDVSESSLSQRIGELAWALATLAAMTAVSVLPLRLFGYRLYRPAAVRHCGSVTPPGRGRESIAVTTLPIGKPRPQLTPDPLDVAPPDHVVSEPIS